MSSPQEVPPLAAPQLGSSDLETAFESCNSAQSSLASLLSAGQDLTAQTATGLSPSSPARQGMLPAAAHPAAQDSQHASPASSPGSKSKQNDSQQPGDPVADEAHASEQPKRRIQFGTMDSFVQPNFGSAESLSHGIFSALRKADSSAQSAGQDVENAPAPDSHHANESAEPGTPDRQVAEASQQGSGQLKTSDARSMAPEAAD